MAEIGTDSKKAAQLLSSGELVAIPTETVYGLAGNALSEESILKIYKAKNRPSFDPLIAHFPTIERILKHTIEIPQLGYDLAENFWPGPLTMLLCKNNSLPDILTSGLPFVATRMPNHPLTLELLHMVDFPIAAPSANPFGYVSPTTAAHVNDQLGEKISYILDGGSAKIGLESTIVSIDENMITIHRLGGLKLEELERFGAVKLKLNRSSNPVAPGQLKSHYAPKKKVIIGNIAQEIAKHTRANVGVISFSKNYAEVAKCVVLSSSGNLDEAAMKLFDALREMDNSSVNVIVTELFPAHGLGRAINDRLQRAAST